MRLRRRGCANCRTSALTRAEPVEANLTLVAYLQAGLHRASVNNGRCSPAFQAVVAKHIVDRRFQACGDVVAWTATLVVPRTDGQEVRIPISGSMQNIRERMGRSSLGPTSSRSTFCGMAGLWTT